MCSYGYCIINLTDGVAVSSFTVCSSEVISGATGCAIWFLGCFPSSDN